MRIVTPDEKNGIYLGRQGENLATQVQFDVNVAGWVETYGVGTWELLNRRPPDPAGYPVEISVEDNIIKWDLTATDLKYAGCGTCELVYYVDEVIAKSIIYGTQILPAIDGTGEIPEPWESWIDEVKEARDEAQAAAEAAAGSASSAEGFAQDASASAAEASDSAYAAGQSADAAEDSADAAKDEADRAAELADQIEHSIDDIEALIPPQASAENQLADKNFVNSSISTNTANYISNNGQPFTSVAQLEAYSGPVSNNDYAFVTGTDSAGNTFYDRYKATVAEGVVSWAFEYKLNNSSFTAAQWAAIESGITSSQVSDYNAHLANQDNPHSVTKGQVGLGNVDNTPDALKPVSQAQAAALALKADKVADAVAGDFAALDANGNLTDSGISKEISEQLEGELVSFKAAYAVPLKALSVALAPIQDLNGYASPWPAGGGKNKWGNGDISKDAANVYGNIPLVAILPAGTYTLSCVASSETGSVQFSFRMSGGASTFTIAADGTRRSMSFTLSGSTANVYFYGQGNSSGRNAATATDIQIEVGSTATDFAPYENICPIFGHTEVEASRKGLNLWDFKAALDYWGSTYTDNGDGSFTVTALGSAYGSPYEFSPRPIDVTISAAAITHIGGATGWRFQVYDENTSTWVGIDTSALTKTGIKGNRVRLNYSTTGGGATFNKVQIEAGTTASTYQPYDGDSFLFDIGINQWDEEWELGTISATTGENVSGSSNVRTKNFIPVKPNTTYFYYNGSAAGANLRFYDANKQYIGAPSSAQSANGTLTTPENAYYLRFACLSSYGTTYSNDISINYPARFKDYYAHTGRGMVYGGTLNVLTGVLSITQKTLDLATAGFYYDSGWKCWTMGSIPDAKRAADNNAPIANAYCDRARAVRASGYTSSHSVATFASNTGGNWFIDTGDSSSLSGQLVYELATPVEVQLTPAQVETLVEINNVYADNGPISLERWKGLGEIIAAVHEALSA